MWNFNFKQQNVPNIFKVLYLISNRVYIQSFHIKQFVLKIDSFHIDRVNSFFSFKAMFSLI